MSDLSAKPAVLIIDDELPIRRLVRTTLEAGGFRINEAENGQAGIQAVIDSRPDLVLLDLHLPDMHGLEVLKRLREWYSRPVVILSVVSDEETVVTALDTGADDYLTKPFGARELLARIRLGLRHGQGSPETAVFQTGTVKIDLVTREVTRSGERLKLTSTEYDVLRVLARHAGKVLTHRQIITEVWGPRVQQQVGNLRVVVTRLRQKLEVDPNRPDLLLTESGVGYRLNASEPAMEISAD